MPRIDTETRLCAVIGNPVAHSLSPAMHNAAFEALGLNYVYLAFRVEDVGACLAGMRALPSFRGMSVTIPHKPAVMEHLDRIDPMAERVGSVNTITNDEGTLIGSTTDGPGALKALRDAGVDLDGRRVLFTGSGGAVRAVAFAVAELSKPAAITILGRTPAKVEPLVADLRRSTTATVSGGNLDTDIRPAMAAHDIVIQGTPVGMHPWVDQTCIPEDSLRPEHVVFDMVYRPRDTLLIQHAEARACRVVYGLEMLVNQAVLQFERWTGVDAPYGVMRRALVGQLEGE